MTSLTAAWLESLKLTKPKAIEKALQAQAVDLNILHLCSREDLEGLFREAQILLGDKVRFFAAWTILKTQATEQLEEDEEDEEDVDDVPAEIVRKLQSHDWMKITISIPASFPEDVCFRGACLTDASFRFLLREGKVKGLSPNYVLDLVGNRLTSLGLVELAEFINEKKLFCPDIILLQLNRMQSNIFSFRQIRELLAQPQLKALCVSDNPVASIASRTEFLELASHNPVAFLKVIWIDQRGLKTSTWKSTLRNDPETALCHAMEQAVISQHQQFYTGYGSADEISRILEIFRKK